MAVLTGDPGRPLLALDASRLDELRAQLREAVLGDGLPVLPLPPDRMPPDAPIGGPLLSDDVALVVETSGSTAQPKRVALSAGALRAGAEASASILGGHGQWVLALPAHYIAGVQVLVRSIVAGTDPVPVGGGRFEPAAFAEATALLSHHRLRFTSLVPVQLARLVDAADTDGRVRDALRSYDRILLGGQAAPPALVARATELGARVTRTYGSSETAGGCVYDGMPLPGVGLRIVDGEVRLSGPMLAEGYLDDPERTDAAFVTEADGRRWYRTADLGELVDGGALRIRGRVDDVIVSGGVKVALGEVERAVRTLDGLGDAVAVAVPDAEWGERPAVVTTGPAVALDALAAATDAAGLPAAARPVHLLAVGELPLLSSGKPDRRAIATLMADAPETSGASTGTATPRD